MQLDAGKYFLSGPGAIGGLPLIVNPRVAIIPDGICGFRQL